MGVMSSSLIKLCEFVSDVVMAEATKLQEQFVQLVQDESSDVDPGTILMLLAFMNWTFVQGVWSNISNNRLRRDLQIQLKEELNLRLAFALTESSSATDTAAKAVAIQNEFIVYLRKYTSRMQSITNADSRMAKLFAFEQIQAKCGLSDEVMNRVGLELVSDKGISSEVELVALEVNKAAAAKRGGFLSKLFRS
jgi:hypothetical protein